MNDKWSKVDLVSSLKIMGRVVAYYPVIAQTFGSISVGVFLSQFLYWEEKQKDEDGWIHKTQAGITRETGLSRTEQETVRRKLKQFGVLEDCRKGQPARLYYKFDWDMFQKHITEYVEKNEKPVVPKPSKPPVKKNEEEPFYKQMSTIFDQYHKLEYPELPYVWSKKEFGQLSQIKEKIITFIKLKEKDKPDKKPITEERILEAWDYILENLPQWHRENQFFPGGILGGFPQIIQLIFNTGRDDKKSSTRKENAFQRKAKEQVRHQ